MNKQFGKYRLLDKIATGGMAEIWLSRQTGVKGFEKLVVLKKILPEFTKNPEFVEMFLDEARVAAMLTHANIVQIYDLGKIQNSYFIAMEYIFGLSLDHLLIQSIKRNSPLPLQFSCHIISQSATGLHYAHTMKDIYGVPMHIVHRDISPQNILVSFEGVAKVVDFGIAKAKTSSKEETQAGKIKGKVSYMSPEQMRGEDLDGRSDVFALAIVLYEITTGKRLFPGVTNPFEVMDLMLNRDFVPPHILNPQYPKILSKILMKALAKDKNKRYKSALNFSHDLDRFLKSFDTPVYSNDLSNWLKKTFQDVIKDTKSKHEDLLWEDDDSMEDMSVPEKLNKVNYEDEEEATVFGKPKTPPGPPVKSPPPMKKNIVPPLKKPQTYNNDEDEEKTMIFTKSGNFSSPAVKNIKPEPKAVNDDFFDFPDDDDFDDFGDIEEESTFKGNSLPKTKAPQKELKPERAPRTRKPRKPLSYSSQATNNKPKAKPKKKEYKEEATQHQKVKEKKSFFSWLIGKTILVVAIYSVYFIGLFGFKYWDTEQELTSKMENAITQTDKALNIKESIRVFCESSNTDVKCIDDSFKIIDNNDFFGFKISYIVEEKLLFKWSVKKTFNYEKKINSR